MCPYYLIALDEVDLGHLPDPFQHTLAEPARVPLNVSVIGVTKTTLFPHERVLRMHHLQEVEMVVHRLGVQALLEHHDIRVVNDAVWGFVFCNQQWRIRERRAMTRDIVGIS